MTSSRAHQRAAPASRQRTRPLRRADLPRVPRDHRVDGPHRIVGKRRHLMCLEELAGPIGGFPHKAAPSAALERPALEDARLPELPGSAELPRAPPRQEVPADAHGGDVGGERPGGIDRLVADESLDHADHVAVEDDLGEAHLSALSRRPKAMRLSTPARAPASPVSIPSAPACRSLALASLVTALPVTGKP